MDFARERSRQAHPAGKARAYAAALAHADAQRRRHNRAHALRLSAIAAVAFVGGFIAHRLLSSAVDAGHGVEVAVLCALALTVGTMLTGRWWRP